MNGYHDLKGVQNEIKRQIDWYTTINTLWCSVTLNTKKDGTPFKNMSKNFNNATINRKFDGLYLEVFGESTMNGYVEDTIPCDGKTVEEINTLINKKIQIYQTSIKSLKHQLEISENTYNEFDKLYRSARNTLIKRCGGKNDLYFAIYSTIEDPW